MLVNASRNEGRTRTAYLLNTNYTRHLCASGPVFAYANDKWHYFIITLQSGNITNIHSEFPLSWLPTVYSYQYYRYQKRHITLIGIRAINMLWNWQMHLCWFQFTVIVIVGQQLVVFTQQLTDGHSISLTLQELLREFDVHVTVHGDKFLKIKPTRCTNLSRIRMEQSSILILLASCR
jgi:hypothetical protein